MLPEQSIFGLQVFDDDQLLPMNPAGHDHQEKCEQRRHGTHAESLTQLSADYLDSTGSHVLLERG